MESIKVNVNAYMGAKIREYRKRMNWTQAEFGRLVGAADNTVASWERGTREPNMHQLYTIAKLAGVNVSEFFPPMVSESEQATEKHLIAGFRNLNKQGQTLVTAAVKGLSQMPKYKRS